MAEAIVFTIAVFLFFQFQGYERAMRYMPMVALVIGLTVKSSEALIAGLSERLLASISALIQGPKANAETGRAAPPAEPPQPNPAAPAPPARV